MPIDDLIPLAPDDPGADLARRLAEERETPARDAFEGALLRYRDAAAQSGPSPDFTQRLWRRVVPDRSGRMRLLRSPVRLVAAAAAIVLVAIGAWLALSYKSDAPYVASSEIAVVTLDDGSTVTLRPRSTLSRLGDHQYRLDGEAFFNVTPDPSRAFRVVGPFGEVRVLGTRFDVSTWGNRTAVFLESGRIAFEHAGIGSVDTLFPGEHLIATAASRIVEPAPNGGAASTDWLRGTLVLDERPVSAIVAEMEHHFGIRVLVPDRLSNETLSGHIVLSDPGQTLSDLGIVLSGRFQETEPNVFQFSSR